MSNNVKQYKLTINRKQVEEIFSKIDGYHEMEIIDLDKLIQGMMVIAERKIPAYTPTGVDISVSMWDTFVENLIIAAVESGSVGVRR